MKVDQNDIYGMYYDVNGDRIDQRVIEMVDSNDYYGSWTTNMNTINNFITLSASFDKYVDKDCQFIFFSLQDSF